MIHVYVCMYYNNPSHMKVNGEHYFKISKKLKQFETSSKLCPPFLLVFTVLYISIIVGLSWAFLNIFIGLQKNEWPARNGKQCQSIVYIESNPLVEVLALLVSEAYTECISY